MSHIKQVIWLCLVSWLLAACSNHPIAHAPDFSLRGLDGNVYRLRDFRGRIVLINFWATWCALCRQEMPTLQQAQSKYANKLVILGINMREDEADVRRFASEYALTFPLLLHPDNQTLIGYRVQGIPITYIVSADGSQWTAIYEALTPVLIDGIVSGTVR